MQRIANDWQYQAIPGGIGQSGYIWWICQPAAFGLSEARRHGELNLPPLRIVSLPIRREEREHMLRLGIAGWVSDFSRRMGSPPAG